MQIITGKYRARKLEAVDAISTRPTLARVKESIFNLIQNKITGAVVLDLFAGSGAFGAECISRGAKKVYFVDDNIKAISTINKNTRNMTEDFEILNKGFVEALADFKRQGVVFDLIYLDPPYDSNFVSVALDKINNFQLFCEGTTIVVEHKYPNDLQKLPNCYIMEKSRKYGIATVTILSCKK